ncbi:MAG: T9SS type A sorting domain-containing protein, partial [Bacteroidota bacterium]
TQSTITNFSALPINNNLGWASNPSSSTDNINNNLLIPITHTGYANINVIDDNFWQNLVAGTNVGQTQVHILTINIDHSIGGSAPSAFYLASTSENHPALEYIGSDFISHPVIAAANTIFPVEYLDFQATQLENWATRLSWTTALEINNRGFEIQRLLPDGNEWENIGFVEGNGNSQSPTSYEFLDTQARIGENTYRLKQIDFDGAFAHSDIRTVFFEGGMEVILHPNPTKDRLTIRFNGSQTQEKIPYRLMDMRGKVLMEGKLDPQKLGFIQLEDLPEGTYLLSIKQGFSTIEKRVVKH